MKRVLLVLCGAVAGGVLGYFAFLWIARQGFLALVLPGALVGIGAALARNRSVWLAVVCGSAALLLGVFAEWRRQAPWADDPSLAYFLRHLHEQPPIVLLMIVLGGVVGLWAPWPRTGWGTRW